MRVATHLLRDGYRVVREVMFRTDPEWIHETMIHTLGALPARGRATEASPVEVAGIRFPNRVGVAAGLDKDGIAARAWAHLGFGFAELGTVTARPQPGNPRPRLFRAPASRGIINRMGFNNAGAEALAERLRGLGVRRGNLATGIPLGVSIGKTKVVPLDQAVEDYVEALGHVAPYADYVAVNVSSPNTPGLRRLQGAQHLERLLTHLTGHDGAPPIFVKLAPDMDRSELEEVLAVVRGTDVAGVIATNTTLARDHVAPEDRAVAAETGGLSGAPLTSRALRFVEAVRARLDRPVMGVGGILTPRDAHRMFDAGANLVQLYTGFIYEGPALVRGIHEWGQA